MKHLSKLLAVVLALSLLLGLTAAAAPAAAPAEAAAAAIVREGDWYYTVTNGEATIVKSANAQGEIELWPGTLGGYPVTAIGSGAQRAASNNKTLNNAVLFPDSVKTLNTLAFYDYNNTALWSFPAAMVIAEGAMVSCTEGNIVRYAAPSFTAIAGEGGWMQPNGSYALSDKAYGKTQTFVIEAAIGQKIEGLTVDGAPVAEAAGQVEYSFAYTFSAQSQAISVTFADNPEDTRTAAEETQYVPVDLTAGAVADGAVLQEDVYAQALVNGNENDTVDYNNAIGLNNALYSASGGKIYKLVGYSVDKSAPGGQPGMSAVTSGRYEKLLGGELKQTDIEVSEPHFNSVAEVINYFFAEYGLVYGQDYDYVRLYNYFESIRNGPPDMQGDTIVYGAYLYTAVSEEEIGSLDGAAILEDYNTNIATVQVLEGGSMTLEDVTVTGSPGGTGPQEASNFYGMGAGLQVEGGLGSKNTLSDGNTRSQVLTGESFKSLLVLDDTELNTRANGIFATGHGSVVVHSGTMFTTSGHGPYASYGGQILINCYDETTDESDFIDDEGYVTTDPQVLATLLTDRPDPQDATVIVDPDEPLVESQNGQGMTSNVVGNFVNDYEDDTTEIITVGGTGTTLAMDTGGGMIVANRVIAKAYGLRSACIYSIGSEQSFEYLFNSYVVSVMDAAFCSCDGGYIFAYNTDAYGIMGIKTRSGGDGEDDIHTLNCRVATYFNIDDIGAFYDIYDAQQIIDDPELYKYMLSQDDDTIESNYEGATSLNFFVDGVNTPAFEQDSLDWWYTDRNLTPGRNGGARFAVILLQAGTGVTVENTCLYNRNYEEYGDGSQWWAEHEGKVNDFTGTPYAPAQNLLISVQAESGGMGGSGSIDGTVRFVNENSATKWDLTGADDSTCELTGDFFIDEGNTLDCTFINSEWTGTVEGDGCSLHLDADSYWTLTGDVTLERLDADKPENITSQTPVTITYYYSESVADGQTIGNVTYKLAHRYFSDVTEGAEYVDALAAEGIVLGTASDGKATGLFAPEAPMQKAHFALMLLRALDMGEDLSQVSALLPGISLEGVLTTQEAYAVLYAVAESLDITAEAADRQSALAEWGVYDPALKADSELTRLQAAALLAKLLENKPVTMMGMGMGDGMAPPDGDAGMMGGDMMGGDMMGDPGMGSADPGMAPPAA